MNEADILRTESHEFITKETTCIGNYLLVLKIYSGFIKV